MPDNETLEMTLHSEVLSILCCPACRAKLRETPSGVECEGCASKFPRVDSIIRFVDEEFYAGSFGFEWARYARTQLDNPHSDESEVTFRKKTGLSPEEVRGRLVLDVGCGMGRFAEVASRWGARVVAFDLSRGAEFAARNLADRNNVWACQADLFHMPFAPESFDLIYSIGVLQHTPDCEGGFKVLPRYLKPGGTIAVSVYSGYNKWYRMSDIYRRVTTRMPAEWLHAMCKIAAPLYYIHRGLRVIPGIGSTLSSGLNFLLPVSPHPNRDWRILDTFNWYSPPYQSKHTYEEVFRWFEECKLEDLHVLEQPISVRGRKPAVSSSNSD